MQLLLLSRSVAGLTNFVCPHLSTCMAFRWRAWCLTDPGPMHKHLHELKVEFQQMLAGCWQQMLIAQDLGRGINQGTIKPIYVCEMFISKYVEPDYDYPERACTSHSSLAFWGRLLVGCGVFGSLLCRRKQKLPRRKCGEALFSNSSVAPQKPFEATISLILQHFSV